MMMFKIQFQFPDRRLLIALTTQLFYHGARYDGDEYDGKLYEEHLSVLNEYKDCIKGFDVVKENTQSRMKYCTFEGSEGEDCYCEVWVSQIQLEEIIA